MSPNTSLTVMSFYHQSIFKFCMCTMRLTFKISHQKSKINSLLVAVVYLWAVLDEGMKGADLARKVCDGGRCGDQRWCEHCAQIVCTHLIYFCLLRHPVHISFNYFMNSHSQTLRTLFVVPKNLMVLLSEHHYHLLYARC